ncbi:glycerophosphodiester phosphodiesterase [Mucilaginibacter sp. S1162]|uniref:Glycerophosphodiester phosphodiesterase n=2 Tax=Mucilaginibacter humi TaxID=2732510 RepID=A0ABX1W0L5_9SPHI|nr:glycerophosphodiester phosphodiesterase [Mucilaginibacter humi]
MGLLAVSCSSFKTMPDKKSYPAFFKVGHRGTRGLMPENTIEAMIKGIEVGANMVEMDVHITKDGKVVVYHDESFNPAYTLMPDGKKISAADRTKYTFYQMNYADIKSFIIGTNPAYPKQENKPTYAPLLGEMIDAVEAYTKAKGLPDVYWLVEIKSAEKTDGFDQPAPEPYMKLVMDVLKPKKLGKRLVIQSFDMRPLQVVHRTNPDIALGYLTGDKNLNVGADVAKLGFVPMFYNPAGTFVTADIVKQCHEKGMLIAPWTINTLTEMKKFKSMGVDGIITDYPNYFKDLE